MNVLRRATATLLLAALAAAAGAIALLDGGSDGGSSADATVARAETRLDQGARAAARRKPLVVMLVLDEFPTDVLRRSDGAIDAARYPNFAKLAATSTWFPNHTTVFDETSWAIPAILDGRRPRPGSRPLLGDHPRNLFTLLAARGWGVTGEEVATSLCPQRLCGRPIAEKPELGYLLRGRPGRLRRWVRSIKPRSRPWLYLKHEFLPHKPWVYLPSGKNDQLTHREPLPGINSTRSFDDRYLALHNERRQQLQVGFLDRQLGYLLARLRRTGLLDRSLIVVTADHGYAWELGVNDRRKVTQSNVDEVAPVPLFVKAPRQRRGRVSRAYARTIDILPTIADLLGTPIARSADGASAFGRAARQRRVVRLQTRNFAATVEISAAELEARRARNTERRLRTFGDGSESRRLFGSAWAGVYRAGPSPELIGRRVAALAREPAGPVRARIADARLTRWVRRSSSLVHTHIAGRVTGGSGRDTRVVAVSVDGVLRATGRTFYLRREDRESFSTLVPQSAMRPGRHVVRVWEVRERGGITALTPLGSNR